MLTPDEVLDILIANSQNSPEGETRRERFERVMGEPLTEEWRGVMLSLAAFAAVGDGASVDEALRAVPELAEHPEVYGTFVSLVMSGIEIGKIIGLQEASKLQ